MFQMALEAGIHPRSFVDRNIGTFQLPRTPASTLAPSSIGTSGCSTYSWPMRADDVRALFDFTYWADREVLAAAAALPDEAFIRPIDFTYRNLQGTLVHTLDVERSWRSRLRGEPKDVWDAAQPVDDYPTAAVLRQAWSRDEAEMRSWLDSLTDDDLGTVIDLGDADRFPLWFYLVHIVTHSEQQRRDAQLILEHLGNPPPDLEFLYYADSLASAPGANDVRSADPPGVD
jgi:uncharacterized damage-inducible protein DinB